MQQTPPTIAFYDIETYRGFTSDIAVIGFKEYGQPYRAFYDSVEFMEHLKSYPNRVKVYGYNNGHFDNLVLLENLKSKDYPISIKRVIFSGSSINTMCVDNVNFKDLILCFGQRMKLNDIAKDFFKLSKVDFDSSNITSVTPELIKYNEQDVILTEKIYDAISTIMADVPVSTAASMSFNTYKLKFNPQIERICPMRGRRDTYKGGRTEIFKFQGKDVDVYDVNSMYPYVMSHYTYPVGRLYHEDNNITKDGYSFAHIIIPNTYIPYLGIKHDNKLMFPTGEMTGYFTNFELRRAKQEGCDVEVYESFVADNNQDLFAEYIKHFYDARLEAKKNGEKSKDVMYKTLMNCLYGKFGQKQMKDRVFSLPLAKYDRLVLKHDKKVDGCELAFTFNTKKGEYAMLRKRDVASEMYHDYVISSYVTAYARDTLYKYFKDAGVEETYYCDTDSIFTTGDLSNHCGSDLGLVKKENTFLEFEAIAPKLYKGVTKDRTYIKAKGFGKIAPEVFDTITINGAVLWDFKRDYLQERKSVGGMRESMRRFDSFFSVFNRTKHIVSEYNKRERVGEVETKPLNLLLNTIQ